MKTKLITLVLIILLFICLLSSCNPGQVLDISIAEDFSLNLSLDSDIILGQTMVNISYSSGKNEKVLLRECLKETFDTSTTGNKKITLTYKGFEKEIDYIVSYNYEVLTTSRLSISIVSSGDYTYYEIKLNNFDLEFFKGISFTLTSDDLSVYTKNIVANDYNKELKLDIQEISNNKIGFIILNNKNVDINLSNNLITLQQNNNFINSLEIKDIQIYDGLNVYKLPVTKYNK